MEYKMDPSLMVSCELVEQFLEREKDDARRWLRDEMDLLVDTMFVQLKNKFANCLSAKTTSSSLVLPTNNNEFSSSTLPECHNVISNQQQQQQTIMAQTETLANQQTSIDIDNQIGASSFLRVKLEIPEDEDEQVGHGFGMHEGEQKAQSNTDNPSVGVVNSFQPNFNNNQMDNLEDDDTESDCDCDSCNNFNIIKEERNEFNQCDVNLSDDDEDEEDNNQINNVGSDHYKDIQEEESEEGLSNAKRFKRLKDQTRIIVIGLKCSLANCNYPLFSTKKDLQDHLLSVHRVLPYQCHIRGCNLMFLSETQLRSHISESHSHLQEWQCSLCDRSLANYQQLTHHFIRFHQAGNYRCSYPNCQFTGSVRTEVYKHFELHQPQYRCPLPQCGRTFLKHCLLKTHIRTHGNIRPYICRYPGCRGYSSGTSSNIIRHIRTQHFNLPRLLKDQKQLNIMDNRDPKMFVHVVEELLNFGLTMQQDCL